MKLKRSFFLGSIHIFFYLICLPSEEKKKTRKERGCADTGGGEVVGGDGGECGVTGELKVMVGDSGVVN